MGFGVAIGGVGAACRTGTQDGIFIVKCLFNVWSVYKVSRVAWRGVW